MIVITGAAGFIASALVNKLNNKGLKDIVIVDDFSSEKKNKNLEFKVFRDKVDREDFFEWLIKHNSEVSFVFHLGARTDTAEFNIDVLNKLNLEYSKKVWMLCTLYRIPLVYASSAATYGAGECGYSDSHEVIFDLKPLNPYGTSKNEFDKFTVTQKETPPYWIGLKFFNVYGPNEYHKGRMASVVFHAYNQILNTGKLQLFRSHRDDFADGMQLRDFIYVKDIVNICYFLMQNKVTHGIYNAGTGNASSFLELGKYVFSAMNREPVIEFIVIPEDIRNKYQYYTQAEMQKLVGTGFNVPFYTLQAGIHDYVSSYLSQKLYY